MYSHVLIVGGTGMLFEASLSLARNCRVLTSIARTERSLRRLDAAIGKAGCVHHMCAIDWSRPDAFVQRVTEHLREEGDADLVLAWLHDDHLGPRLATTLAPACGTCAFFQVRGSAAANPANWLEANLPTSIDYHQIVLGFRIDGGSSRWLRDDEISAGVLAAIEHPRDVAVVGTVEPWSRHP